VGSNPSRRALEPSSFADWLDAKTFLLGCPKRLIEVAHKIRYGFTRYFGHLKRLGWVEETGRTEPSGLQDDYPPAPSRVYYRITDAGRKATLAEVSNPIRLLYPNFNDEYYRGKKQGRHYYRKCGFSAVATKPYSAGRLEKTLRKLLNGRG
jgi:hypothetical protein